MVSVQGLSERKYNWILIYITLKNIIYTDWRYKYKKNRTLKILRKSRAVHTPSGGWKGPLNHHWKPRSYRLKKRERHIWLDTVFKHLKTNWDLYKVNRQMINLEKNICNEEFWKKICKTIYNVKYYKNYCKTICNVIRCQFCQQRHWRETGAERDLSSCFQCVLSMLLLCTVASNVHNTQWCHPQWVSVALPLQTASPELWGVEAEIPASRTGTLLFLPKAMPNMHQP